MSCRNSVQRFSSIATIFATALVIGFGCSPKSKKPDLTDAHTNAQADESQKETRATSQIAKENANDSASARQLLERLFATYKSCESYSDETVIRLTRGKQKETANQTTMKLSIQRPNLIALSVKNNDSEVHMVCDGKRFRATIKDPGTQDFFGQVAQQAAPERINVDDAYAVTEFSDPNRPGFTTSFLFEMLPFHLEFSQLAILLSQKTFDEVFQQGTLFDLLNNQQIGTQSCRRIRVTSADKKSSFVFWLDESKNRLLRLEYPVEQESLQVIADFHQVRVNAGIAIATFVVPDSKDRLVRHFVLPPLPLPSSKMGKTIPTFDYETLAGKTEKSNHLAKKHVVFCWFDREEPSNLVLQKLQTVASKYKNRASEIAFRVINAEPKTDVANQQLRSVLRKLNVQIPAGRDTKAVGRDVLGIELAPTVVVISNTGVLQFFEVGANPQIGETVDLILQSLLQGENVGALVVNRYRNEVAQFHKKFVAAQLAKTDVLPDQLDKKVFPPRTEPEKFRVHQKWTLSTLPNPRNLIVVENPEPALFAVHGIDEVVQIDLSGKILQKKKIPVTVSDGVTHLRSFQSKNGTLHVGTFSVGGRQAFVLDQSLDVVFAYPRNTTQKHPGIQDAILADLDSDNEPEVYIAFADPIGIHRVDLRGKKIWSVRSIPGIQSIAVDQGQFGRMLVAGESGRLHPVYVNGELRNPIAIGQRTVHEITSTQYSRSRPTVTLGLSFLVDGRRIALGLNGQLREQWSYGLPNGVYTSQVAKVASVAFGPQYGKYWLLTGPDGSVHLIKDDGEFFDSFQTGEHVFGLAAGISEDTPVLFLSRKNAIVAYEILGLPEGN